MQPVGNTEQTFVGKSFADERNSERQTICFESGRQSDCCEIQKVHKIGVIAEVRIQLNGIGLHGCDRVLRWCCGQQQKVNFVPYRFSFPTYLFQSISCVKSLHSAVLLSAANDRTDGGIDRVRISCKKLANGNEPFGDPRPFVEKCGRFSKWFIIE